MKKLAFILLVTFVLLVTGCSSNILDTSDIFSPEDFQTNYDEDKSTFIQLNIDTAFSDSKTVKISGNTITITDKGDGIAASSKLLIDDGTFKIVNDGENTSSAADEDDNNGSTSRKGIKSSGSIVINGGSFIINSVEDAIHSDASININGGSFQISTDDDGIHADDTIEISSGEININRCYEGIEGSKVKISGGIITLNAIDDGINAAGSDEKKDNSNGSIIISDGNIYIKAGGDGIDSNGTLTISGGLTVVCCPSTGDTSIIDFDVSGTIEGGYFLAVAHLACLKSLVNQNKVSSH